MRLSKYRSITRKLQAAYRALEEASDGAEYFAQEHLLGAQGALCRASDQLRVQACKRCNKHGSYFLPDSPGVLRSCQHPEVPAYDIRTDEI